MCALLKLNEKICPYFEKTYWLVWNRAARNVNDDTILSVVIGNARYAQDPVGKGIQAQVSRHRQGQGQRGHDHLLPDRAT